ncbi:MAG: cupredoxin domain-containing protein [Deltaproteobacteria bacterium]|nr:cupredoxin domain-containing protein [Deltaproteobacteria bacterium]
MLTGTMFFRIAAIVALFFLQFGVAHSAESEFVKRFKDALEKNDTQEMSLLVSTSRYSVPDEVRALLTEAQRPDISKEDKDARYNVAEIMAREYKDAKGEAGLLIEVKQAIFNARLSTPIRPILSNGVAEVRIPKPTGASKNVFLPDNIVIKKGEAVRWINDDAVMHVFSALKLISADAISSPKVEPSSKWEARFEKPGEYYYICFIHSSMIGKITVEEK